MLCMKESSSYKEQEVDVFFLHIFSVSPCGSSPPFVAGPLLCCFCSSNNVESCFNEFMFFLNSVYSSMSHLPPVYHDAQHFGQEIMESKQESNGLLSVDAVSIWDSSDWSTFDDALYATSPLEFLSDTILDSIGKLLINMRLEKNGIQ